MNENDSNRQQHAFLLRISNPTLGLVRLRLGISKYAGEPFWDDDNDNERNKNTKMNNLMVDSLTNKHVDATMFVNTVNDGDDNNKIKSDIVELESSEDAFVDMGKLREVPDEVMNWDAQNAAVSGTTNETGALGEKNAYNIQSIKMITKKSGLAWFEIVCEITTQTKEGSPKNEDTTNFNAIPIALEIQVGQGSWESSLIKAKETKEGEEPDCVTFDLLLAWPRPFT